MIIEMLFLFVGIGIGTFAGRQIAQRKNLGEAMVAETLEQLQGMHYLINNVTLPIEGGTTQIDHILLTEAGIFVIETKHYSGWIFGDADADKWTQVIYRTKSRFQNPLRQNFQHIKAVQALFKLPENAFIGCVVFTGDAEFKTEPAPNVLRLSQLLDFVNQHKEKVLDEKQMTYVAGRIEMKRLGRSAETDEYHINSLKNRFRQEST
jgi:hypothetical protein